LKFIRLSTTFLVVTSDLASINMLIFNSARENTERFV